MMMTTTTTGMMADGPLSPAGLRAIVPLKAPRIRRHDENERY